MAIIGIDLGTSNSAATALVLTEWKLVRSAADASTKLEQAENQATRYGGGILAGFELERCRYLVLVSKDSLSLSDDRIVQGITYRHVNIAISPSAPSKVRPAS